MSRGAETATSRCLLMDFNFACSHCGQHLCATLADVGAVSQCPTCSREIKVPSPGREEESQLQPDLTVANSSPKSASAAPMDRVVADESELLAELVLNPKALRRLLVVALGFVVALVIYLAFAKRPSGKEAHNPRLANQGEDAKGPNFTMHDQIHLRVEARHWADVDLKTDLHFVSLPVRIPTNQELDDYALRRWRVFEFSDAMKQSELSANVDRDACQRFWIAEYKTAFIAALKPKVEASRRANAPAF